jgi:hypothetical protein
MLSGMFFDHSGFCESGNDEGRNKQLLTDANIPCNGQQHWILGSHRQKCNFASFAVDSPPPPQYQIKLITQEDEICR